MGASSCEPFLRLWVADELAERARGLDALESPEAERSRGRLRRGVRAPLVYESPLFFFLHTDGGVVCPSTPWRLDSPSPTSLGCLIEFASLVALVSMLATSGLVSCTGTPSAVADEPELLATYTKALLIRELVGQAATRVHPLVPSDVRARPWHSRRPLLVDVRL